MEQHKSNRSFFAHEIFCRLLQFAALSLAEKIIGLSIAANPRKLLPKNF